MWAAAYSARGVAAGSGQIPGRVEHAESGPTKPLAEPLRGDQRGQWICAAGRKSAHGMSSTLPVVRRPSSCPVGFGRLRQRKLVPDPYRERAVRHPAQHFAGALEQLGPVRGVVANRRSGKEERALLR